MLDHSRKETEKGRREKAKKRQGKVQKEKIGTGGDRNTDRQHER